MSKFKTFIGKRTSHLFCQPKTSIIVWNETREQVWSQNQILKLIPLSFYFILNSMKDNNKRLFTLISNFFVINIISILSGLLYQKLAKSSYHNTETNHYDQFRSSIGYCVIMKLVTWILAEFYCKKTLKKEEYVIIDKKKSIVCGLFITVSSVSFMETLYLISYPFIMMAKSARVLQTVLAGFFYTRMGGKKQELGREKIINSFIVILGVVFFKIFDPETSLQSQASRHTELLGFLLLMINLIVDCFYPDFQTEIQYKYNPKPAQMLVELSKWSFIICLIVSIFHGDLIYTISFMYKHPIFLVQILALAVLSFLGQTFVYKIIQNFQQNFVSLITNTRKIFTIAFNLIIFGHRISYGSIAGILMIFSVTIWQFLETLNKNLKKERVKQELEFNQTYQIEPKLGPLQIDEQNPEYKQEFENLRFKNIDFEEEEQSSFESS